jgi:hypothetical protein
VCGYPAKVSVDTEGWGNPAYVKRAYLALDDAFGINLEKPFTEIGRVQVEEVAAGLAGHAFTAHAGVPFRGQV